MKFVDDFRHAPSARALLAALRRDVHPGATYRLMEFCGGHTHALWRYGLQELLPPEVRMIHGPGCPVCVLPSARVDLAIALAQHESVALCTFGDLLRVPGSHRTSLLHARAAGADVRSVYSPAEALELARREPTRQVVFFAIGFETTAPATALLLEQARELGLTNFSVHCNHLLTPSAMTSILESTQVRRLAAVPIDGFVGPAHVSVVIGSRPYEHFAEEYRKPVVIAGFEPLDLLQAILMLVRQVNAGQARVENQYRRAVTREGNARAQAVVSRVFELRRTFEWRGLGTIPYSALRIREAFSDLDAEQRFPLTLPAGRENPACQCGAVLRGALAPEECPLFGTLCTPESPIGSCMVSSEGACAAHYTFGRRSRRASPPPASTEVGR
ncbi:MAG: hydrogenase formation protein HypD [Deltaproteobacteria bacterium]|nr:hydrogenase formation protein HypD [Deltaproteobacteria bacterium]